MSCQERLQGGSGFGPLGAGPVEVRLGSQGAAAGAAAAAVGSCWFLRVRLSCKRRRTGADTYEGVDAGASVQVRVLAQAPYLRKRNGLMPA